jgi:hypothetical protein
MSLRLLGKSDREVKPRVSFIDRAPEEDYSLENALPKQPSKSSGRQFSQHFAQRWGQEDYALRPVPQATHVPQESALKVAVPRERIAQTPESVLQEINSLYDRVRDICAKHSE